MTATDNVVELDVVTSIDLPPERILRKASAANLTAAIVLGYDEDGDFYFASSYSSGPEVLWLLKVAEKRLLDIIDDE